jgi:hypothetical protein
LEKKEKFTFIGPGSKLVSSNSRQHSTSKDKDHFVDDVWKLALQATEREQHFQKAEQDKTNP